MPCAKVWACSRVRLHRYFGSDKGSGEGSAERYRNEMSVDIWINAVVDKEISVILSDGNGQMAENIAIRRSRTNGLLVDNAGFGGPVRLTTRFVFGLFV